MKKVLSSPLVEAANNIVSLGARTNTLPRFQRDFNDFNRFLTIQNRELERLKLPEKRKINALASLNVASTFGRPGGLLGSLFSGALDLGGFLGNMFPGRGRIGKPQRAGGIKPPKPLAAGSKLKFGGLRSVGIVNSIFAGLDFATGLSEGESVGKAAAGAGGALAGGLLGGAIGQALIPIPGVGFVIGNMAGSFLGGWGADRLYEGGSALKERLSGKLKAQEEKQKAVTSGLSFKETVDKFDTAVRKFENGVARGLFGSILQQQEEMEDTASGESYGENVDPNSAENQKDMPSGDDVTLDGQGTFIQGATGRSDGPHFHIGPTELYDPKGDTWVGKTTEQGKQDARDAAFKVAKALMQQHKYFIFTNAGITINPGSKIDDETLMKYVEREQVAHRNRKSGGSWGGLDIAGEAGLRLPVPVDDVVSSVHGFGNAARITGTNAFVGHGMTGSKKTPDKQIIKTSPTAGQENFAPQQGQKTPSGMTAPSIQPQSQQQQVPQGQSNQQMNIPQMIAAAPMESMVIPQNIQYYPSYNQTGGVSVIMPILMGGGGGGQSKPVYIPVGGGGGGTVILPGPTEGQVVNSLMKTMLLTNLSAT